MTGRGELLLFLRLSLLLRVLLRRILLNEAQQEQSEAHQRNTRALPYRRALAEHQDAQHRGKYDPRHVEDPVHAHGHAPKRTEPADPRHENDEGFDGDGRVLPCPEPKQVLPGTGVAHRDLRRRGGDHYNEGKHGVEDQYLDNRAFDHCFFLENLPCSL